jgi:hypothetical protein
MITEDQLEQLAIQWFQDTGWNYVHGAVIAPEGVAAEREALRTLTPALSQGEKEEDGRLVEAVRRMGRPFRAWDFLVDGTQGAALGCRMMPRWGVGKERGKPLNKERRYPIALTMRGHGDVVCRSSRAFHGHRRTDSADPWVGCPVGASATHKDSLSVITKSKGG